MTKQLIAVFSAGVLEPRFDTVRTRLVPYFCPYTQTIDDNELGQIYNLIRKVCSLALL